MSHLPVVFERTPTLLTSDSGAGQDVHVWYPDERRARRDRLTRYAVLAFAVVIAIAVGVLYGPGWRHLLPLLPTFVLSSIIGRSVSPLERGMRLLPRSCHRLARGWKLSRITTDSGGIALTTETGSTALAWSDVAGWYYNPQFIYALLYTRAGAAIIVNFTGYEATTRKALSKLIRERCGFQEPASRSWLSPLRHAFMAPGYEPLPNGKLRIATALPAPACAEDQSPKSLLESTGIRR